MFDSEEYQTTNSTQEYFRCTPGRHTPKYAKNERREQRWRPTASLEPKTTKKTLSHPTINLSTAVCPKKTGKNRESRCHNRSRRSPPSHVSTKSDTNIESKKYLPTNGGTEVDENATNKKVVGGLPGRNARRRRLETKTVYYTSIFLLCIPILIDNSQRQPNWGPTHRTLPA